MLKPELGISGLVLNIPKFAKQWPEFVDADHMMGLHLWHLDCIQVPMWPLVEENSHTRRHPIQSRSVSTFMHPNMQLTKYMGVINFAGGNGVVKGLVAAAGKGDWLTW